MTSVHVYFICRLFDLNLRLNGIPQCPSAPFHVPWRVELELGGGAEGHGVVSVCRCACRLHFGLGSHGRVNSEIIQVVPTYLETAAAQRETCSKGCTPHEWVDPRLPRLRIILLGKYLVLGTGGHQVGRLTVPIRERVNELSRSLFFQHQIGQLHRFRTEAAGLRSEFRQVMASFASLHSAHSGESGSSANSRTGTFVRTPT